MYLPSNPLTEILGGCVPPPPPPDAPMRIADGVKPIERERERATETDTETYIYSPTYPQRRSRVNPRCIDAKIDR